MKHGMTIRTDRYQFFAWIYFVLNSVKGRNKIHMVNMNKTFANFTIYRLKICTAYLAGITKMR